MGHTGSDPTEKVIELIDPRGDVIRSQSNATHLECARCEMRQDHGRDAHLCPACNGPLLVRYDLERIKDSTPRSVVADRPASLWRYRELLPIEDADSVASLGEGMTPVYRMPTLGRTLGLRRLSVKDDGLLPTGSFKARGAAVGVSRARELGAKTIALPTAGNAGAAWAAYGARVGITVVVVMPEDTPEVIRRETTAYGAQVYLVDGSIADAGAIVRRACAAYGWYNASTLAEPYRIEGKKTMGYELAEQLGWSLPDVIVYPTGGGVGLIGMWKAFEELRAIGWLDRAEKAPRFIAAQSSGCAPIVEAFHAGRDESEPWPNPTTVASGLRVPKALGDFLILRILRESGGNAIEVADESIIKMMRTVGNEEGLLVCPEGAAGFEAARQLRQDGLIDAGEDVVVFNTGTGLKYVEALVGPEPRRLRKGQDIAEIPEDRVSGAAS